MYYPRFTKVIIHHFITKDKLISMRNRMSMHTAEDDSILGTMRFVSKSDEYQVYEALLPKRMTNKQMWDSHAYKPYLSFATGATFPKKVWKFKKPDSPLKKRTLVTVEEEEPETAKKVVPPKKPSRNYSTRVQIRDTPVVSMSKKKALTKAARRKWIDLLSEASLLKEAQLKKDLKRSKQETSIHQAGGSSEGSDFESEVLDQRKGKSIDTKTNDDEEETDDKFVHTPPNYVPTDDESNDESNDVNEEEYDRIDKELYGDVNTQEQTTGVQEESGPEMASVQGQYVVQATKTATPAIQNATTKIPPFSSSHSVSSNYTSAFLNLKNLQSTLDDALYKVLKKHDADIIKEFSVPTAIFVDKLKKRKPDDADKDEGPTAGSNRGLKRQRTSKGTKTSKKMPTSKDSSKGKSPSSSLKSSKSGKSAKDQIDNLTKEHLVGPVYNLLKGTCKSYVELDYTMEECYRALSEQLNWNNPRTKSKAASKIYMALKTMDPNLWLSENSFGSELTYVCKKDNYSGKGRRALVGSRKLPEEAQPHQAKNSRFELHKFSDGTFTLVRDTLSQMLHDLHLGYNKVMRRRQWTRLDQQRTRIMIKAINQNLLERRIMRSLEKLVGGREYVEDLRLLQRTI
ncbi:hypothetical protein Tco_1336306 [Tanacetum coccineum]